MNSDSVLGPQKISLSSMDHSIYLFQVLAQYLMHHWGDLSDFRTGSRWWTLTFGASPSRRPPEPINTQMVQLTQVQRCLAQIWWFSSWESSPSPPLSLMCSTQPYCQGYPTTIHKIRWSESKRTDILDLKLNSRFPRVHFHTPFIHVTHSAEDVALSGKMEC